jgi:hypothetical protein
MRKAPGIALAVTAAVGLGACSPAPIETSNYPEAQEVFDTTRGYFPIRGFDLSATKLVTIGSGESFTCTLPENDPVEMHSNDPGIAAYCAVENTVAIAKESYDAKVTEAAAEGIARDVVAQYVLAHEVGHAVQHAKKPLYAPSTEVELDADCISGIVMNKRYEQSTTDKKTEEFYKLLKSDEDHGTTQQRIDSFNRGKAGYC